MSLLHQIQEAVVQEGSDLGSVLLKLRLLASRLGSGVLEEWVKHESEGYPEGSVVPSYRIVGASYKGSFFGPGGGGITNAKIPTYLIEKYAGESWTNIQIRKSIASIDELVQSSSDGGNPEVDASNLMLLLQGKIYPGHACNDISGIVSRNSLAEIQQAVRCRILELTLELEKSIPAAALVAFGAPRHEVSSPEKVQQISQQIIYGNVTTAVAGGQGSNIAVDIRERDTGSFIEHLVSAGFPRIDASEFAAIIEAEEPSDSVEPFGQNAKHWIATNLKKAAEGTWNMGISVATAVLTEAALKFYGLK